MPPSLLITRPAPGDAEFADAARTRLGCDVPVVLSPVLRIEGTGHMVDLQGASALIISSRHTIRYVPACGLPLWVVGRKVAEAAQKAGLVVAHVAQDSAALIADIKAMQPPGPFLHLRGDHIAGDIANTLAKAGFACAEQVVYRQQAELLTTKARVVLDGEEPVVLPLFSPRSCTILYEQGPFRAPGVVLAISNAVARALPDGAAEVVLVAERPDGAAMLEALPAAVEAAKRLEGQIGAQ